MLSALGIIGGAEPAPDAFPTLGALLVSDDVETYYACTSTLIAPDVAVLAAHCIDPMVLGELFRDLDLQQMQLSWTQQADLTGDLSEWAADAQVIEFEVHPDWDPSRWFEGAGSEFTRELHDIGLVALDTTFETFSYVYRDPPMISDPVTIAGWGLTQYVAPGDPIPAGATGTLNWAESTIDEVGPAEFYVGTSEEPRQCPGDSGGPAFITIGHVDQIAGLASHVHPLDAPSPCASFGAANTRMDVHLDWTNQALLSWCDEGSRVWCETPGLANAPAPTFSSGADLQSRECGCNHETNGTWLLILASIYLLLASRQRDNHREWGIRRA